MRTGTILLLVVGALIVGCSKGGDRAAQDPEAKSPTATAQVMEIGCGEHIYHMDGVTGCVSAIKVDGKPMLLEGEGTDADALMAQGFCVKPLEAEVVGQVDGDKFVATSLTVKKAE